MIITVYMYFVIVLMQDLTAKTKSQQIKGKKDQVAKIVYTEEGNGKVRQCQQELTKARLQEWC